MKELGEWGGSDVSQKQKKGIFGAKGGDKEFIIRSNLQYVALSALRRFICSAVLSFSVSFPNLSQTLFDFIMMNDCTNWPGKEPPSSNIGLHTLLRCLKSGIVG
ncbi:hypothetical protein V6N13_108029 [Hibiscus sabdariffa]|uniref:Uncharacterized protein n=1 Tax=Hibiscus sabdariffa TaxID=183260 RepID=A0ABR2SR47_9ROSI